MKRTLKIIAIVLVVVVLAFAGLLANTFRGRQSVANGVEINGIRVVADGITSLAVLPLNESQVALIDAGNDPAGKAILAELSRRKLSPDAVTAIFLTHGHADHRASIPVFPKAQVMALAREIPVVEGRETGGGPLLRLMGGSPSGLTVNRPLQDGETVTLGTTQIRVFAVPGHTPGSAAYLVNRVLFLGDAADASSGGKILRAPWIFSGSQQADAASLIRLTQRLTQEHAGVQALEFAHSGILKSGLTPLEEFARQK